MHPRLGAIIVVAVLSLAGCGAGSTPSATGTSKPPVSTPSVTHVPAARTAPAAPADAALRASVQAYSDAYLTGKAQQAFDLLTPRCQKMYPLASFSVIVAAAGSLYGTPLPMTSFKAHIAGGMARVTYTYTIAGINQTDQPWTLEAQGWRDDNC
jgi:hypothetical protein